MYKIGTVCVKTAGRDAGKLCVVVEEPKDGRVLVDGETRRRLTNLRHLEPTGKSVNLKTGASSADVCKLLGVEKTTGKKRSPAAKPQAHTSRKRKEKSAEAKPKKAKK